MRRTRLFVEREQLAVILAEQDASVEAQHAGQRRQGHDRLKDFCVCRLCDCETVDGRRRETKVRGDEEAHAVRDDADDAVRGQPRAGREVLPAICFVKPQPIGERADVEPRAVAHEAIDRGQVALGRARAQRPELTPVKLRQSARERADEQSVRTGRERSDRLRLALRPAIALEARAVERGQPLRARADEEAALPRGETRQLAFGQPVEV